MLFFHPSLSYIISPLTLISCMSIISFIQSIPVCLGGTLPQSNSTQKYQSISDMKNYNFWEHFHFCGGVELKPLLTWAGTGHALLKENKRMRPKPIPGFVIHSVKPRDTRLCVIIKNTSTLRVLVFFFFRFRFCWLYDWNILFRRNCIDCLSATDRSTNKLHVRY